jgi:cysteine synthase A
MVRAFQLCNLLAAIKLARHQRLGPEDVLITVATDGAALYASELRRYLERHGGAPEPGETMLAELCGRHLFAADTEHVLEATTRERERIFNLGYFTWVEQQNVPLPDFEKRRSQAFWRGLHDLVPQWDEMIDAFNHDTRCA